FQAEDGIRDRNVTGVQTCALPIWKQPCLGVPMKCSGCGTAALVALLAVSCPWMRAKEPSGDPSSRAEQLQKILGSLEKGNGETRSEERRVGKEGRARRGSGDEKKE